jgi:hypothetical protein
VEGNGRWTGKKEEKTRTTSVTNWNRRWRRWSGGSKVGTPTEIQHEDGFLAMLNVETESY